MNALGGFKHVKDCSIEVVPLCTVPLCHWPLNAALLTEAKETFKAAEEQLQKAKAARREAAAEMRRLEKDSEYGALSQEIRQSLDEEMANLFNIHRSSWHGGAMVGNYCRKMLHGADQVMDSIVELLQQIPQEKRARGCDDAEIQKYCNGFKRILQYMGILSHYSYQPYGTITDSEMASIRDVLVPRLVRLFRKMSKTLPPKIHMLAHLVEDLERFRGMKFHHESKIEVAHQIGKRIDYRFRSMAATKEKRMHAEMKFEAN
ncbi:expressed unknown protein [Seminavis robusta]|uniref:Uncharacterized protein n=1 Tax=Seminavis robusta TaxID=568900 RepID=A0A9N8HV14_9STRA|nr:expressed unknown protein [Seminavis robusta]|eukprot:Sro1452_g273881.1  (261) ;mRNA; r:10135-10917